MNDTARREPADFAQLLVRWHAGDRGAFEKLFPPQTYEELRMVARKLMKRERVDHTLGATALVNETIVKLLNHPPADAADSAHLFRTALVMMRRTLIDWARAKLARGGRHGKSDPEVLDHLGRADPTELQALCFDLAEATRALAAENPRAAQALHLHYVEELTYPEAATKLGVSPATVKNDCRWAKNFLRSRLGIELDDTDGTSVPK